jgi:hypothetical protein
MKKVLLMPEASCKKQHAKGSNVSSHSNKTPSATSFLSVAYLEQYVIHWDECDQILRPIPMERAFSILQIQARETPGQTGTIWDKIVIWVAHQLVRNEPAVDFPTPQEDTSCKELADSILLGI